MEDQDRDFIERIKSRLQLKREGTLLREKKALSDRDILEKGANTFWSEFRKAIAELCDRVSRETGVTLSCRWNGEELNVNRPNTRHALTARLGSCPPYQIAIVGAYAATVSIVLEDSQVDWLAVIEGSPAHARKIAAAAIESLVLAD